MPEFGSFGERLAKFLLHIDKDSYWRELDSVGERLQDYAIHRLSLEVESLCNYLELCESPIERLLLMALDPVLNQRAARLGAECIINPQQVFETDRGEYRVDFHIAFISLPKAEHFKAADIVIECDGHDFHERTKQQAKNDKSRDRAIQAKGIPVLRFTGSEIWANPDACAKEAARLLVTEFESKR